MALALILLASCGGGGGGGSQPQAVSMRCDCKPDMADAIEKWGHPKLINTVDYDGYRRTQWCYTSDCNWFVNFWCINEPWEAYSIDGMPVKVDVTCCVAVLWENNEPVSATVRKEEH